MLKNLLLGVALVGCALACKTEKAASVADPSTPTAPSASCCAEMKGECSAEAKAACAEKKAACEKTCPASKPQN
jgi:hypothetical protein